MKNRFLIALENFFLRFYVDIEKDSVHNMSH